MKMMVVVPCTLLESVEFFRLLMVPRSVTVSTNRPFLTGARTNLGSSADLLKNAA